MHECEHEGCSVLIDDKYHYCYTHRKDTYLDSCYIHGVTEFILGVCQQCKKLKTPIYRIHHRDGKYYVNKDKKPLPSSYFLKPYYKILTHKISPKKYIGNITTSPGIYAIFVRDSSKKDGLGKCLYVGQSNNIKIRIARHKKNFVTASNHLKGLKAKTKSNIIIIPKYKVEAKYYLMARDYYLKNLKFVSLYKIEPKKWASYSTEEQKLCLTYLEQAYIDALKPSLNRFAARPSYK